MWEREWSAKLDLRLRPSLVVFTICPSDTFPRLPFGNKQKKKLRKWKRNELIWNNEFYVHDQFFASAAQLSMIPHKKSRKIVYTTDSIGNFLYPSRKQSLEITAKFSESFARMWMAYAETFMSLIKF